MSYRERDSNPFIRYVPREEEAWTWLVSDPHFDHENIIRYCDRPFETVAEMNDCILSNWNNNIKPDDLVFFLGDMAFGRGSRKPRWWLGELNGRKVYLKGSHDNGIRSASAGLGDNVLCVADVAILVTDVCSYMLVHDPSNVPDWWRGWVVHGHVHDNRPYMDTKTWYRRRYVNVSVEVTGYKPITVKQLVADTINGEIENSEPLEVKK